MIPRERTTERKYFRVKDVAVAGGWSDVDTLLTCYQHPDKATLLTVMSESRKVSDVVSAVG
jgi:hypothetical protein